MLFILQEKETQGTFYMKFPLRSYNSSEAKSSAKIIFQTFPLKKKMFYSMLKAKKERYLQNLLEEEKGDGVYPDVLVRGQQ